MTKTVSRGAKHGICRDEYLARATDGDFRGSGFIDVEPRIPQREPLRRISNQ